MTFLPGQRWISEAEPELGLGVVRDADRDRVRIVFPTSGEERQYVAEAAPLRRVAFRTGDLISIAKGATLRVASVIEHDGLLTYEIEDGRRVQEADLGDALGFGSPDQRLLRGQIGELRTYDLRQEALRHQFHRRRSAVRGFVGGRMDLIPHQLFIAHEVTRRAAPRVLLADEVGLGKTIEACLIVHRLLATGRASRVLVVVPESLVHQWFVELLRRFNLWFHIYDEERCESAQAGSDETNPFLECQLVLCGLPLLLDPRWCAPAAEGAWDLLVVDEAHHLHWTEQGPGPEYRAIETISRHAEGLLLLTATPEQLGLAGHFARLRLLDPDRFANLAQFEEESRHFGDLALVANKLLQGRALGPADRRRLRQIIGAEPQAIQERLAAMAAGDEQERERLVGDLLDRHGTGRVMFRNTRSAIQGFPRRVPRPVPLPVSSANPARFEDLAAEFERDCRPGGRGAEAAVNRSEGATPTESLAEDPRIGWLAGFLRAHPRTKVLLITRRREKVLAIDAALRERLAINIAMFHEGMDLVQRDRNAAWFAEPDGARILLASEIGSEGRNFQFAHHLVLFDLPLNPELLEQRIGRLDRIGQTADIQIHVPYVPQSPQEVLCRWFQDGLDALRRSLLAGREMLEEFGARVYDLAQDYHETHAARRGDLEALVARTRARREELDRRLEQGRDRLLELNSHRPSVAADVVRAVSALDQDTALEDFLLRVWDHFGVPVEDLAPRTFRLGADGVYAESFPALPREGLAVTFDRRTALAREDWAFLTWDHPMVTGALDLLLGSTDGTCACVVARGIPRPGLWIECTHLLECVAPPALHADRFLPATPVRVVADSRLQDVTGEAMSILENSRLRDRPPHDLLDSPQIQDLIRAMIGAARTFAEERARPAAESALAAIEETLGREIERLRALAAVNPSVRPSEIAALEAQREQLRERIRSARLRLDSVRLVVCEKG